MAKVQSIVDISETTLKVVCKAQCTPNSRIHEINTVSGQKQGKPRLEHLSDTKKVVKSSDGSKISALESQKHGTTSCSMENSDNQKQKKVSKQTAQKERKNLLKVTLESILFQYGHNV